MWEGGREGGQGVSGGVLQEGGEAAGVTEVGATDQVEVGHETDDLAHRDLGKPLQRSDAREELSSI